jgi:hypothetical protein
MLELLSNPEAWMAFLTLTALELVLGIDNIIFISILVDKLPAHQKELARKLGGNVFDIKDNQFEELMLGNMMDKVKTGKTVSKESILKKLRS